MSFSKKLFAYILIFFASSLFLLIALPSIYSQNSAGRIDKKIALESAFLHTQEKPFVLLYFGYVGCVHICTPAMQEITNIYEGIDKDKVAVYFISLLEEDSSSVQAYAKYFHKDFQTLSLSAIELQELKNTLGIQTSSAFLNKEEINHAGHLYLLEKNPLQKRYFLKYIYTTRPLHSQAIIKGIVQMYK